MAEKALLAYFNTPDQAQKALDHLKQLRVIEAKIDRFDGMPGDEAERIMSPLNGNFGSLGDLTLDVEFENRSSGIMSAAGVSASGYGSGGPENRVTGRDILLTAIVDEEDYEKAREIVRRAGAL